MNGCIESPEAITGADEGFMPCAGLFYRNSFVVEPEAAGKRFWLEFEGVVGITEVWINKKLAAKHINPYTSFWAEVTALLHAGENEISLYTDNRTKPNSRWYVGCGVYWQVWLYRAEAASVLPHGLFVTTKALDGGSAVLELRAQLSGPAERVRHKLTDADGRVLAEASGMESATLTVKGITPWTPESPVLYTIR